jgi:hypothetical protein
VGCKTVICSTWHDGVQYKCTKVRLSRILSDDSGGWRSGGDQSTRTNFTGLGGLLLFEVEWWWWLDGLVGMRGMRGPCGAGHRGYDGSGEDDNDDEQNNPPTPSPTTSTYCILHSTQQQSIFIRTPRYRRALLTHTRRVASWTTPPTPVTVTSNSKSLDSSHQSLEHKLAARLGSSRWPPNNNVLRGGDALRRAGRRSGRDRSG